MRRALILSTAVGATLALTAAVPTAVEMLSWKELPTVKVTAPLLLDSVDAKGKTYDRRELLDTKYIRNVEDYPEVPSAQPDSIGGIKVEMEGDGLEIREYVTNLRADRYAKGNLHAFSDLPFRLYVNGVEKGASDDLGLVEEALTLEPEADTELRLRFLLSSESAPDGHFTVNFTPEEEFEDVRAATGADMKRRFSLADTEFGPRVTDIEISPDGNWLLLQETDKHTPESSDYSLKLIYLPTGKTTRLNPYETFSWMPSGATLSVGVKNGDTYDLYVQNPSDGSRKLLAHGLPDTDYSWNNTADRIYISSTDPGRPDEGPLHRYTSPDDRIPGNRDISYISSFDPKTGATSRITRGSLSSVVLDLHPREDKLLLGTLRVDEKKWPFSFTSVYEYDANTGALDTIIADSGFISDAIYSPDGKKLLVTASAQEFGGIADRSGAEIPSLYDKQLYILDRKTGAVESITTDFDPSVGDETVWNRSDGNIYFLATKGFGNRVFHYSPSNKKFTELPLGIENISAFSMARDGTRLAYRGMSRDHCGGARVYNIRTGKDISAADPYADHLAGIELADFQQWNFTASDGTEIEGYCVLPPGFDPDKKYPLIVYYYGGTLPTQFTMSSPYSPQLFASRDYVVYMLNPSGTIGYGQEFSARHVNAWGKRTAEDIIEGTEKFVKDHPFVDADNIGCIGASYGGFMTQYLQTLTDIFAAAVSHAGISNVTSYWGEGYWGYSYNAVAASESYPWSNPELFTRQGSLFNADKIHTPLLLLHGTADTNVPTGESIQLFNALKILGRDVELITVEGENHFISDYPKRKQWNDTIMAWFARWLQDDPRWWESLYPSK